MIRSGVIRRRLFAAAILYGFAVGSALFWNDGRPDWTYFTANFIAATAGLFYLHSRWRAKERKAMTPQEVKDIFS